MWLAEAGRIAKNLLVEAGREEGSWYWRLPSLGTLYVGNVEADNLSFSSCLRNCTQGSSLICGSDSDDSELLAGNEIRLWGSGSCVLHAIFKGCESLWSKGRLFPKMAIKILPLCMISYCLASDFAISSIKRWSLFSLSFESKLALCLAVTNRERWKRTCSLLPPSPPLLGA